MASPSLAGGWVHWGIVAYVMVTLLDLVTRRGFVQARRTDISSHGGLPVPVGVPIGAVVTILGVGESVMTVPALRRAGASMAQATTLANPLTLAIVVPATVTTSVLAGITGHPIAASLIDWAAALSLLAGACHASSSCVATHRESQIAPTRWATSSCSPSRILPSRISPSR